VPEIILPLDGIAAYALAGVDLDPSKAAVFQVYSPVVALIVTWVTERELS
jgi:hypothetical protein